MLSNVTQAIKTIMKGIPALLASVLFMLSVGLSCPAPAIAVPLPATPVIGLFHFSGARPANLGVQNGQLVACPATPNCVSSFSQDAAHRIEPLHFNDDPQAAFSQLKATLQALPRTQIITESDHYLYAEFTSAWMGFVDDVEFYLDQAANVIQVRSASRLGESDLGVNRERIEAIRAGFNAPSEKAV